MEGRDRPTDSTRAKASLRSSFSSDPEMRELVDFFIDDLARRVAAISSALDALDRRRLRVLAHQLYGSAEGYGFRPIGEAARILEEEICANQLDDGLAEEVALSVLREKTEDLLTVCRRAIPTPDELP
jgi:HPt (histidine-containing phosphotransfer) domain-containing protein